MTENKDNFAADESRLFGSGGGTDRIFYAALLIECIVLAVHIFLNTFVFSCVVVSGGSMQTTLFDGDVLINSLLATPDRGDVVIIDGKKKSAKGSEWIIKRVIALGGDAVDIKDGKVYLKKAGETTFLLLGEPYLDAWQTTEVTMDANPAIPETGYPFTVPEGEIYFLGDNRIKSLDSRSYFGTCKESEVVGVVKERSIKNKAFLTGVNKFMLKIKKFFSR